MREMKGGCRASRGKTGEKIPVARHRRKMGE
jgi:hypothetical protein